MSVGEGNHYQPSQHHDCANNKQQQAPLAKPNSHRCIRILRPAAQSHDEFADTLGVFVNARSNDANSHPRKQQPGWCLARLPLHGLAHRSSNKGVFQVGAEQGSARDGTA
ncbi:MAG TPA: hypothetical protein VK390_16075 [Propionibacteriaceae bacterium]|jgi:hypothetical protein|nr:hypothetical protein [Propionibacteriaceae bacterium]